MKYKEWIMWPSELAAKHFAEDESNVRELVLSAGKEIDPQMWIDALRYLEGELDEAFGSDSFWHEYARMHWSK